MKKKCSRFLLSVLFMLVVVMPASAEAKTLAKIEKCLLNSSTRMTVQANLTDLSSIPGNKVYLFSIPMGRSKLSSDDKPISSAAKKSKVSFQIKIKKGMLQDALNRRYLIAARKNNQKYAVLSAFRYATNASSVAKYKYAFPKAESKKGLQVHWEMQEDAQELNVHHGLINIVFTEMLASAGEENSSVSIPFTYEGKQYWFRRSSIQSYDSQLKRLSGSGAVISAVLLLGLRSDCMDLIYPGGRAGGHNFYAWNCRDTQARRTFQAILTFLAKRYSAKNSSNGRIVNWIVGNEVNDYRSWNYAGERSLSEYASIYADAFRLTYNAVTAVYANARVYISLNHLWNTKLPNCFTAHQMLDAFASSIRKTGPIQWNLAYHPYGSPLTEPRFWENKNKQVTNKISSPVINMNNLSVLSDYVRKNFGSNTRIILSEQGYTSHTSSGYAFKEQAAAIAYSYYLTEADDMVDSFIMNRHIDHQAEINQGLNLGLWTTQGTESANQKKLSWKVFKYMDTTISESVTKASLKVIGAKSWGSLIKGFSKKLYAKTPMKVGTLQVVSSYTGGRKISGKWNAYGASSGLQKSGNAFCSVRSSGNKNRLWGITQSFSKKSSLKPTPNLCMTVRVAGSDANKALIKIRVFSGKSIYECEKVIPSDQNVKLRTSLAGWSGIQKVTKIQILVTSAGGGWRGNASVTVSDIRGLK